MSLLVPANYLGDRDVLLAWIPCNAHNLTCQFERMDLQEGSIVRRLIDDFFDGSRSCMRSARKVERLPSVEVDDDRRKRTLNRDTCQDENSLHHRDTYNIDYLLRLLFSAHVHTI
jgi:hypothetical protein